MPYICLHFSRLLVFPNLLRLVSFVCGCGQPGRGGLAHARNTHREPKSHDAKCAMQFCCARRQCSKNKCAVTVDTAFLNCSKPDCYSHYQDSHYRWQWARDPFYDFRDTSLIICSFLYLYFFGFLSLLILCVWFRLQSTAPKRTIFLTFSPSRFTYLLLILQ